MMHCNTISITKSNEFSFYKDWTACKAPNITALSNISFATILTKTFLQSRSHFCSHNFINLDKKLQDGITEGENIQEQKLSKLSIVEETICNSYC